MPENEYFADVARLRRLLEQALSGDGDLPDYLKPENQVVSEQARERSKSVRDALVRGDYELLRQQAHELIGAGFDRKTNGTEEEEIDEVEEARDRVRERREQDLRESDEDESRDRDR